MRRTANPLEWIRPAKQERAQQTVDRFLRALEQLLDEKGFAEASVAEIAAKADASVGAFYARFRDKDALLHALHEGYCKEAIATAEAGLEPSRWEGVPLADVVAAFAGFVVDHYRARPGLRRAFALAQWHDARFRARSAQVAAAVSSRLGAMFEARAHEHAHDDPRVAGEVLHRATFAMLDLHVQFGDELPGAVAIDDARLKIELVRMSLGYLGAAPPPPR